MFGQTFLDLAMQQLGKPYVWGGAGPDSFDCSGLCMWTYGQVSGIEIPHNDEVQYNWWTQHPELADIIVRGQDANSPEDLQPGDLIFCQFEGGSGNGHEMIYVGSPAQSDYANPDWNYTYLQAPSSHDVVKLSSFEWNRQDTAHGGARGLRFGRFVRLKYPPGMEPREEADMALSRESAIVGKELRGHAFLGPLQGFSENCYLHFTGLAKQTNVTVQVFNDNAGKDIKETVALNKHVEIDLMRSGLLGSVTFHAYCDHDTVISPDWRSIK